MAVGDRFDGGPLFVRKWRAEIGDFATEQLDIAFRVVKSLKDHPNDAHLFIWNLNKKHREQIEEMVLHAAPVSATKESLTPKQRDASRRRVTKGTPVRIFAGYDKTGTECIFKGDLRTAGSVRQGPDWITTFESGDGEKGYQNGRINQSFGPDTNVSTALRAIAEAFGIDEGNLKDQMNRIAIQKVGKIYPQGTVIHGPARDRLNDLCKSSDLEWSIQDGAFQFLPRGEAHGDTAIVLSSDTGMIDAPTVDVDGILSVRTLMIKGLRPGKRIKMEALLVKGMYRIEKISYLGDTAGKDWGTEINASRI